MRDATQHKPSSMVTPVFYRLPELMQAVGLGKTKIYAMIKSGEFPRSVQIGPNAVGWRPRDVQAWADSLPYRSPD